MRESPRWAEVTEHEPKAIASIAASGPRFGRRKHCRQPVTYNCQHFGPHNSSGVHRHTAGRPHKIDILRRA